MTAQLLFTSTPPAKNQCLVDEHLSLDRQCSTLIARTTAGDWRDCDAIWDAFSGDLERHMAYEENELFPDYEKISQTAAQTVQLLRAEHQEFRRLLAAIGIDIQLHLVRAEVLRELVGLLLDHAQRERQSIYTWIEDQNARNERSFGCDEAFL